MARAHWIVPWADSDEKPAIDHPIARMLDWRFVFEETDQESFRIYLPMSRWRELRLRSRRRVKS
jgi:hypothetical protein